MGAREVFGRKGERVKVMVAITVAHCTLRRARVREGLFARPLVCDPLGKDRRPWDKSNNLKIERELRFPVVLSDDV